MNNRTRYKISSNGIRFDLMNHTIFLYVNILIFSVVYILAVNNILTEDYMAGSYAVLSYEKDFNLAKSLCCIMLVEFLFFITQKTTSRCELINYVKYFLFFIYEMPVILSYGLFDHVYFEEFITLNILYWLFFCICSGRLCLNIKPIINWSLRRETGQRILLILVVVSFLYIINSVGGVKLSLTLRNVYGTRQEFKDNATELLVILKTCLGLYICPCMIASSIKDKKVFRTSMYIFLQIIAYSFAKDKMYLFLLGVAVLIGLFGNAIVENFEKWLGIAMMALSTLNIFALFGFMYNLIFNIFTRRFFTLPAWLNWVHFFVFHDKEKIWWRQDTFFIDKFLTPVYDNSVVQIISREYFSGWIANPNAGMFAEAYTRCGNVGVIIYPILIVITLNLINYFFDGIDKIMLIMLSFSLSVVLSNDAITSTSFVGTMIFVNIFFMIVRGNRKK